MFIMLIWSRWISLFTDSRICKWLVAFLYLFYCFFALFCFFGFFSVRPSLLPTIPCCSNEICIFDGPCVWGGFGKYSVCIVRIINILRPKQNGRYFEIMMTQFIFAYRCTSISPSQCNIFPPSYSSLRLGNKTPERMTKGPCLYNLMIVYVYTVLLSLNGALLCWACSTTRMRVWPLVPIKSWNIWQ